MNGASGSGARSPDAVVVGSGPNGLAAALTLARAGLAVALYEGAPTPGGGCQTEELTLPGFHHDRCSTVHPLLAASPFFLEHPLPGVTLNASRVAFAHPLDRGDAAAAIGTVEDTAASMGADAEAYRRLLGPLVREASAIVPSVLAPLARPPAHPLAMTRFGLRGLLPATVLGRRFSTEPARALLAGLAAHSMQPLNAPGTSAFALVLGMLTHTAGWPVVEGGSARVVDAMLGELAAAGGTVQTGRWVHRFDDLPAARVTLLDLSARAVAELLRDRVPSRYLAALRRFRYGPGACKVDWALDGPVPWTSEICRKAPTLHLGGTFEEIVRSEAEVAAGRHPERPFCIAVQPCVVDPTRAPAGQHTFYAYCHVPSGSPADMRKRIENQVERFAPGFRDRILAHRTTTAVELERHNPNLVGGDLNCGAATLWQTLVRPVLSLDPYRTPDPRFYICSASAPPGGGVHGMCGVGAARSALRHLRL
jgi:phytoene dehydrogenase-like protein